MGTEFPALFCAENTANLQIALEDGRIVSHVGIARQTLITGGCRLPAACIGSVGTHPDFRGKGLATELVAGHSLRGSRAAC